MPPKAKAKAKVADKFVAPVDLAILSDRGLEDLSVKAQLGLSKGASRPEVIRAFRAAGYDRTSTDMPGSDQQPTAVTVETTPRICQGFEHGFARYAAEYS